MTYVIGSKADFERLCKGHRMAGVRHIPDRSAAESASKSPSHKVVILPSAEPDLVFLLTLLGFNVSIDPEEQKAIEREKQTEAWDEKLNHWLASSNNSNVI